MATQPLRFKTISEFHKFRNMPKPAHPLISVINLADMPPVQPGETNIVKDFYNIALKRNLNSRIKYGQQQYDYDDGTMFFISPGQVFKIEVDKDTKLNQSGWMLLLHPDFLWNTSLARKIKEYEFFDYSVNEALFLSEKEEAIINGILQNIEQEYLANIDKFSQNIIIAQIELLLNYAERFYQRQFITRKINNHQILNQLEDVLTQYFNSDMLANKGLPSVAYVAEKLNLSPGYLGAALRMLTGQSTQHHIHERVIEKAKERLSTTVLSVGEIAYALGFEHPQSFSKLFKAKTKLSPLEFRQSFN
jgi:AraC family transcriptional activator of pobA